MTIHQVHIETKNGAETFKVQWPIIGDTLLVYNKDRSVEFQMPDSWLDSAPEVKAFVRDELKMYVKGHVNADQKFEIQEILGGFDYELQCGW